MKVHASREWARSGIGRSYLGGRHMLSCIQFSLNANSILGRVIHVDSVDVFVTSECILLCILYIVTRCLFQDVSIMYLIHVVMPRCFDRENQ